MIAYLKNQNDLTEALKGLIDRYWAIDLGKSEFIEYVQQVTTMNNKELLYDRYQAGARDKEIRLDR